jgi:hypothetical protein
MKIRLMEAELFHTDGQRGAYGQTDMTKLIISFRNFAKAPQNSLSTKINKIYLSKLVEPSPLYAHVNIN